MALWGFVLLGLLTQPALAIRNAFSECAAPSTFVRVSFNNGQGHCTATWISPRVLLTAAHCAQGRASDFRITEGMGEGSRPSRLIPHPRFRSDDRGRHPYDIALVFFDRDLSPRWQGLSYEPVTTSSRVRIAGYASSNQCMTGINRPSDVLQGFAVLTAPVGASNSFSAVPERGDSGGPLLTHRGAVAGVAHQGTYEPVERGGVYIWMGSYLLLSAPSAREFLRAHGFPER